MAEIVKEVLPSSFDPTVAVHSTAILNKNGRDRGALRLSTLGIQGLIDEAAEIGADVAFEPLHGWTKATHEMLGLRGRKKKFSIDAKDLSHITIISEPARSETPIEVLEALKENPLRLAPLFYMVTSPTRFESGEMLSNIASILRSEAASTKSTVPIRTYSIGSDELHKVKSRVANPDLPNSVVHVYLNHADELREPLFRNLSTYPSVGYYAEYVRRFNHTGLSLSLVDLMASGDAWKTDTREFFQAELAEDKALVQMIEVQPNRPDLDHNYSVAQLRPLLEYIAELGWTGPFLVAGGTWRDTERAVTLIRNLFPSVIRS